MNTNPVSDVLQEKQETQTKEKNAEPYKVLARKYRPRDFSELIGQDALVRTLKNAIDSGRIAHAFMLTGVRGVGKTTTARIIAKALNYTGPDGKAGPTTRSTEDCSECQAITEDRHPDVIEMDAASRTGVDDIREIIDGVRYAPVSARYKVYIIDEVHMLSKAAFNALLKTLEEPPEHVIFIFATTEIRKVPVTVLSRCQRFDLRRVDHKTLAAHFKFICDKEQAKYEDEAIQMIAKAADGSVRDGLSLLDQAIALGDAHVSLDQVRDMLGFADRTKIMDLFDVIMQGKSDAALDVLMSLYRDGADPVVIVQDMLDLTHFLTKVRVAPKTSDDTALPEAERVRGAELAQNLAVPSLHRMWQILMTGLSDVQNAPVPQQALEMLVIKALYAAELPDPARLVKDMQAHSASTSQPANTDAVPAQQAAASTNGGGGQQHVEAQKVPETTAPVATQDSSAGRGSASAQALAVAPQSDSLDDDSGHDVAVPQSFEALVELFEEKGAMVLAGHMRQAVHLVRFAVGRLEIRQQDSVPRSFANDVRSKLKEWTGMDWVLTLSSGDVGEPTLAERDKAKSQAAVDAVKEHPKIHNVLRLFPEAEVIAIHDPLDDNIEE